MGVGASVRVRFGVRVRAGLGVGFGIKGGSGGARASCARRGEAEKCENYSRVLCWRKAGTPDSECVLFVFGATTGDLFS